MSDYYGDATLESWLAEVVFLIEEKYLPKIAVDNFEKWRVCVEDSIEGWMGSDDGEGNNLSWRGWGHGFALIPDEDDDEFEEAVAATKIYLGTM